MNLENSICEDCGEEAKHIHHIDKKTHNHSLDNLKALCCKCHKKYHPRKKTRQIQAILSEWEGKVMPLGIQLKLARLISNHTQAQVYELTNIKGHVISDAEKAGSNPRRKTITKLLDVYGYELRIIKKGA